MRIRIPLGPLKLVITIADINFNLVSNNDNHQGGHRNNGRKKKHKQHRKHNGDPGPTPPPHQAGDPGWQGS